MIERRYHCDGPDCNHNVADTMARDHVLKVNGKGWNLHFCGWDCVLRYAATIEPEEVIEIHE